MGAFGRVDFRNVQYTTAEGLTLNGGTVANSDGASLFAGAVTLNNNSTADVTGTSLRLAGVVSGAGGLTKTGAGGLVLTEENTFGGDLVISQGSVALGDGGGSGWLTVNVVNQGSFIFNRANNSVFWNEISGSGSVEKSGAGKITLTGSNSYAGLTTIHQGELEIGDGANVGNLGTNNVINNALLTFNRNDAVDYAAVISGTGALKKLEAGTLTLTGDNSFSGGTTILGGTVQIGNGGTSGAIGSGAITNEGTLAFHRSDNLLVPGGISGSGEVHQNGSGTLTVSGASTYTGATRVNAGRLLTDGANVLSDASAVTVSQGATLQLGGNDGIGSLAGERHGGAGGLQPHGRL